MDHDSSRVAEIPKLKKAALFCMENLAYKDWPWVKQLSGMMSWKIHNSQSWKVASEAQTCEQKSLDI